MSRLATTGIALFVFALGIAVPSAAQAKNIAAYPSPGVRVASNETTISFVGVKPSQLGPVTVRGSRSGIHRGRLRAHPGGGGVSFIPNRDFQFKEEVTVTSKRHRFFGTGKNKYSFATGLLRPKGWRDEPQVPPRGTTPPQWTTYKTFPLKVPKITIDANKPGASQDEVFLAPKTNGPMIVDKDGELIYYRPGLRTTDFRVQRYKGKPVLTWWRRAQVGQHVESNYAIANNHYKVIKRLTAGNGYTSDPHEFTMTNRNTAYVTSFRTVIMDLRQYGGLKKTPVMDGVAQEVDVKTGLVLWEWHSLGNIRVNETYMPIPKKITRPFDYFHLNSIDMDRDGNMILSARHTRALYKVNRKTGKVMWRMGGKDSDFKLGKGMNFAYQHDFRLGPGRTYTMFDNGSADGPLKDVTPKSKGMSFRVNPKTGRATLVRGFERAQPLRASSQGNMQLLSNGNFFVGWGSQRYCTEFAQNGEILWDLEYSARNVSYRCYRDPWLGAPTSPIAVKSEKGDASGNRIWVSWNGDTQVGTWRVLGAGDGGKLGLVGEVPRNGFETAITVPEGLKRFRLVGLNPKGQVLGRSKINKLGKLTR